MAAGTLFFAYISLMVLHFLVLFLWLAELLPSFFWGVSRTLISLDISK